jgi:hypothetical protein
MLLATLFACSPESGSEDKGKMTEKSHQDLLVGYSLLSDVLADESKLRLLEVFKKLTLDAPNDAIGDIMSKLSETSDKRAEELEKLRGLVPDVSRKPKDTSPVGDAINDVAKDLGQSDMMSRKGGFDVRFVLIQAQATRMVAAMATAIARFEPREDRKRWLRRLAHEYEGYRAQLIHYLGGAPAAKP